VVIKKGRAFQLRTDQKAHKGARKRRHVRIKTEGAYRKGVEKKNTRFLQSQSKGGHRGGENGTSGRGGGKSVRAREEKEWGEKGCELLDRASRESLGGGGGGKVADTAIVSWEREAKIQPYKEGRKSLTGRCLYDRGLREKA